MIDQNAVSKYGVDQKASIKISHNACIFCYLDEKTVFRNYIAKSFALNLECHYLLGKLYCKAVDLKYCF